VKGKTTLPFWDLAAEVWNLADKGYSKGDILAGVVIAYKDWQEDQKTSPVPEPKKDK
jgi:hypothetical protein